MLGVIAIHLYGVIAIQMYGDNATISGHQEAQDYQFTVSLRHSIYREG